MSAGLGVRRFSVYFCLSCFPSGANGKESPCQCRRCKGLGFYPWVGKIPWSRKWLPTLVFSRRKFHGQRGLVGYSPWGHRVGCNWVQKQNHSPPFLLISCSELCKVIQIICIPVYIYIDGRNWIRRSLLSQGFMIFSSETILMDIFVWLMLCILFYRFFSSQIKLSSIYPLGASFYLFLQLVKVIQNSNFLQGKGFT